MSDITSGGVQNLNTPEGGSADETDLDTGSTLLSELTDPDTGDSITRAFLGYWGSDGRNMQVVKIKIANFGKNKRR